MREVALAAGTDEVPGQAILEQLIQSHFSFIWRLLRRLGLPESDADDAAQQVFMIANAKLSLIAPGRERAFLYGCALNRAAKWRQARAQSAQALSLDALAPSDLASPERSVEELLDQAKARTMLDMILGELDVPLRTVFVLYEIEQLSSVEIAEMLGLPRGTVASRLRRAREEFEKRVKRMDGQRRPRGVDR